MFFLNDTLETLEEGMNRMLKLMAESHYSGEWAAKEYFKGEYRRLAALYAKEMEDWLRVW